MPLPYHKLTRTARSISGSVRIERTRIEQVRGIVQMQQERQLRMGGEGMADEGVEATGAGVGVVAVALAAQLVQAGKRVSIISSSRKARLHTEQTVATGDQARLHAPSSLGRSLGMGHEYAAARIAVQRRAGAAQNLNAAR